MSRNKNNNNQGKNNNAPEIKSVDTNVVNAGDSSQSNVMVNDVPAETKEQMEARIRAELKEEHDADLAAKDLELKEREADLNEKISSLENSNPAKKEESLSEVQINGAYEQMVAEKEARVKLAKGKNTVPIVDDTALRQINSQKISERPDYVGTLSKAKFMMRQNERYAIENKPEPYTEECIKNTLRKAVS